MIVERSLHPQFLSNTYLLADQTQGTGFFIDAGGPVQPLIDSAKAMHLDVSHVLLTHHHYDHVCELDEVGDAFPDVEVLIGALELDLVGGAHGAIEAGQSLQFGALVVKALPTPGHTAGMLSFLISDTNEPQAPSAVFTGDTLFRGSVGGVRAPGHTTYADLRSSIMETLMALPDQTVIYPGHTDSTTVAEEWDSNPFIRIWRGLDPEGTEPCQALGEPATLILLGDDYDGGKKAWVRWPDGSDDIVPGSQIRAAV